MPGDVNGDGVVTVQDAALIHALNIGFSGSIPAVYCDINGDGLVNATDYNLVLSLIGTTLPDPSPNSLVVGTLAETPDSRRLST